MKKILVLVNLLPTILIAQQTISSTQNGNASNPLVWDCICFPTPSDNVIVNHTVNMDVDWAVNAGGSIMINSSGSLVQTGLHALLVDGTGSDYINNGTSVLNDVAVMNGASILNGTSGTYTITRALYVSVNSSFDNSGFLSGIDSLMTEGSFSNTGTCYAGNLLNTGTFDNSGPLAADSTYNTGTFSSTAGNMYFTAFGNAGTFSMSGVGFMDVANNWANLGDFTIDAGLHIYAHNDFYNGDSLGGSANLHNNGTIEVTNNFLNGFLIDGSGNFCVGNESYNVGTMNGTFDFCDNTGGAIDLNTGTIAGTITFCSPGCFVGIEEQNGDHPLVYPNPSEGTLTIDSKNIYSNVIVYSMLGQKMIEQKLNDQMIDLSNLEAGFYYIQLIGDQKSNLIGISLK